MNHPHAGLLAIACLALLSAAACSTGSSASGTAASGFTLPDSGAALDIATDSEKPEDSGPQPDATGPQDTGIDTASATDTAADTDTETETDTGADTDTDKPDTVTKPGPKFTVVTFNTGTTDGLEHDKDGDNYGKAQVKLSDEHYGNGLAWVPAVDAVKAWLAQVQPDVIAFQEMFYSGACATLPASAKEGFVCKAWKKGDPTVVQTLLGSGYQVACHPGKNDKCVGIRKSFGSIAQCKDPDFCIEGLDGVKINNCGGGARVARATVNVVGGGQITVVSVHGTSGIKADDQKCREKQVEQIFKNMDGQPGANGKRNVILGDLNVDPKTVPGSLDKSVKAWNEFVGGKQPFQWVSDIGPGSKPTYAGLFNIDHVISDAFKGSCHVPGVSAGKPAVYKNVYFDHKPVVCVIGDL